MAVQIPSVTGPSQRTRALGAPQVESVRETSVLEGLARPLASTATQVWQKTQDDADTAALMEAESRLSSWHTSTMFNPENGVYSRKGKNALDITNQTLPQFDAQANEIGNSLTNDRQRARWNQIVSGQRTRLDAELNRYEFGERQVYYKQAEDATLTAAANNAVAYYDDPQQLAYYQNKGGRIIAMQGQRTGEAPELTQQKVLQYNSGISTAVVGRLMQTDPIAAQRYYAQAYEGMTAEDQVKTSKLLATGVRQQLGSQIGEAAYNAGTVGINGLSNLIIQAESSGDPTAVSPKGAKGLMQLMPETAEEMAKELGVPYSEERLTADPNYNMALGNAYLNKMLGRYGGNSTLAVAAYNAGPGSVDEWIKKNGDPRTGQISEQEWINKIPYKETRDYTGKITSQLAPSTASSRLAAATSAANQIKDPQTRKYALDRIDDLNKAAQLQEKANFDQAADIALDAGYSQIPPAMLDTIGAEDRIKLQKLDEHRRKGTEPTTDEAKLRQFLSMPGEQFAQLSLQRDIRPYLNNADFKTVQGSWNKAQAGDFSDQRSTKAENDRLQTVMAQSGILTGTSLKANEPKNLERQQQFRAAYQGRKDAFFMSHGRQPTAQEADDLASGLAIDVRLKGAGFFGGDSTVKMWQVAPEQMEASYVDKGDIEIGDIPAGTRAQIVGVLRRRGEPASEENIKALYIQRISDLGVSVR